MKKFLPGMLALAMGGALASLWLSRGPQSASWSALDANPAAAAGSTSRSLAEDRVQEASQLASPHAEARSSPRTAAPRAAGRLSIQVVEEGSGKPVAGARVLLQKEDVDGREWSQAWDRWGDLEQVLVQGLGLAFVSDESGSVLVDRPSRALWASADRGDLHGEQRIDPASVRCTIAVKLYRSLAIEVVDALGKPATGVRVALVENEHGEWSSSWTEITGSDGRVALIKLEDKLHDQQALLALGPTLALATPQQIEFSASNAPTEPLRFVLEPTGSVEVVLSDKHGRVLDIDGMLELQVVRSELSAVVCESLSLDAPALEGSAVFEHVGLGLEFDAGAEVAGKSFQSRVFAGPLTPGERVRVLLPLESSGTLLSGRALDEHGEPLRSASIFGGVQRHDGNPYETRFQAQTDEQGRFTDEIMAPLPFDRPVSLALTLTRLGVAHRRAELSVEHSRTHSALELGDVVFAQAEFLVRGTVVDAGGAPVFYARIEARDAATHRDLPGTRGPGSAYSDSDGRFVVCSSSRPEEVEIRAHAYGQLDSMPVRVPPGSVDVVVALRRGSRLEGRVRLPEGFGAEFLDFECERAGNTLVSSGLEVFPDGSFVFPPAEPGLLSVRILQGDALLWRRDDVELRAGETTQLGEIDLRDKLFPVRLSVVDASGAPVGSGMLWWSTDPELGPVDRAEISRTGEVRFLAEQDLLSVSVVASGFRTERFESVRSGDRLVLRDGIAVRLTLPPQVPAVDPPLALHVRWEGEGDSDGEGTAVGADGSVIIRLPEPGAFEFTWCIRNELTGAKFRLEDAPPTLAQVLEFGEVQSVTLQLSPQRLLRALEKARGAD